MPTHERTHTQAIRVGVRSTSSVITGAALIMVAIFSGFASGELVMFQQVGFGLGVVVFLDATIVRSFSGSCCDDFARRAQLVHAYLDASAPH